MILEALAAYAATGGVVAVAFVAFGISRVLPQATLTLGARLLLLPGATILWPLVLVRCLESRERP